MVVVPSAATLTPRVTARAPGSKGSRARSSTSRTSYAVPVAAGARAVTPAAAATSASPERLPASTRTRLPALTSDPGRARGPHEASSAWARFRGVSTMPMTGQRIAVVSVVSAS